MTSETDGATDLDAILRGIDRGALDGADHGQLVALVQKLATLARDQQRQINDFAARFTALDQEVRRRRGQIESLEAAINGQGAGSGRAH